MAVKRGGLGKGLDSLIPKKIKKSTEIKEVPKEEPKPVADEPEETEPVFENPFELFIETDVGDMDENAEDVENTGAEKDSEDASDSDKKKDSLSTIGKEEEETINNHNAGSDQECRAEAAGGNEQEDGTGATGGSEQEDGAEAAGGSERKDGAEPTDGDEQKYIVDGEVDDGETEAVETAFQRAEINVAEPSAFVMESGKGEYQSEKSFEMADRRTPKAENAEAAFAKESREEDAASASEKDFDSANTGSVEAEMAKTENAVIMMRTSLVEPNREQPRKKFNDETIEELADSIRQYGVIQPLLVQKRTGYYEIIAGERRWRAAKKAGLREIPVIVREYTSQEAAEISLIENIQREDLNPIEEAQAYDRLIREFSLTQEEVAAKVARSRSAITNSLRLLRLCEDVRDMVIRGDITEGHARAILGLPSPGHQKMLAEQVVSDKLSVRETERLVRKILKPAKETVKPEENLEREAAFGAIAERLTKLFNTKVSVSENGKGKGKIEIAFFSDEEFERIYDYLINRA